MGEQQLIREPGRTMLEFRVNLFNNKLIDLLIYFAVGPQG
jgi:hypothetical protein